MLIKRGLMDIRPIGLTQMTVADVAAAARRN